MTCLGRTVSEMTTAKGYTEMKDSGIQWIGQIPTHWLLKKAKYCVSITNGSDPKSEGSVPVYGSGSESFKTCGEYKEGPAVLIGRKGATLHIPHYIEGRYWNVDTAFDVKPQEGFSLRYYYYLACVFDYNYYISQTTLPGMTQTNYNNMKLPCPSLDEQSAIAAYLDTQCAKIDEIIDQAKASMEDYKQWKASIIYEAVTKGLNPNVEMKDSGVEWIGKVPKRWACCKQKCVMKLINGRAYKDDEFETEGKYRVLRVGNLFSNPKWYYSNLELEEDKYCNNGDLLYAWSMSYGPVIWNGERVIYHYHIWKTKLSKELTTRFAYYYLIALSNNIKAESHATTMGFVTMKTMNNSYVAFPSLVEQSAITTYLDTQCAKIDDLVSEKQSFIDDLESYKKSLIYEVVTGKRRV